jgi:glycosyltransferase involved in cell wall biosynthesis
LSAPRDAVALAAAIEKALLADGATKQRLVDAAHKKALGFTAEATAAQMESVYRSVLRSPSELV